MPVEAAALRFDHLQPGEAYRLIGAAGGEQRVVADADGVASVAIGVSGPVRLVLQPEAESA